MHKRAVGLVLTGILAIGGAGAVAITPASATTSDNVITSRLATIKGALSGLVKDGTLTQAQADKVASTLDTKLPKRGHGDMRGSGDMRGPGGMGGPGGHFGMMGIGHSHDAAAKALGMTTDQLRTAMHAGKSLAAIAKDKKVSVDTLVKAMIASAKSQIATAVKDGKLTQAQADTMTSRLSQRITDEVNRVRPAHGPGDGPRGAEPAPSTGGTSGSTSSTPSSFI